MPAAHATSNNNHETFGAKLRRRRKELGLTLDEVASRLGTNRNQVIRWEKDENFPTTYADRLARLYDWPLEVVARPAPPPERMVEALARELRRLEARVAELEAERGR